MFSSRRKELITAFWLENSTQEKKLKFPKKSRKSREFSNKSDGFGARRLRLLPASTALLPLFVLSFKMEATQRHEIQLISMGNFLFL